MRTITSKSPLGSGLLHVNKTLTGVSTTSASVANPCRETTVPVMADPSVPVWPSTERVRTGGGTVWVRRFYVYASPVAHLYQPCLLGSLSRTSLFQLLGRLAVQSSPCSRLIK